MSVRREIDGIEVEEDGCEVATPMPASCLRWPCCAREPPAPLVQRGRFMACSECGSSYGDAGRDGQKGERHG